MQADVPSNLLGEVESSIPEQKALSQSLPNVSLSH
jgi:hypothetical protein